jgi:hypothetical protein
MLWKFGDQMLVSIFLNTKITACAAYRWMRLDVVVVETTGVEF